jgi:hypothetical protein
MLPLKKLRMAVIMQFSGVALPEVRCAVSLLLGSASPRKSRVFTRHDGTAGDVWSADLAEASTAGASNCF